jgi:hypothetical protein
LNFGRIGRWAKKLSGLEVVLTSADLVKIVLGKFACFCLKTRFEADFGTGIQVALSHYVCRLKSQRAPIAVPTFYGSAPFDGEKAELELAVEPEIQETLTREARRQEVPVSRLLTHAVFVYIADLDAAAHGAS